MRLLLFTGKGGVGKTTLAAATAVKLADEGKKTLVVSTDPAHSLTDAFNCSPTNEPSEVDSGLYVAQVNARRLVDSEWQGIRQTLRSTLTGVGIGKLDAEELTIVPGIDELLALAEVERLARAGSWETVVVDCGPTAETLRLFALPEAFAGLFTQVATNPHSTLAKRVEAVRDLLADPTTTTVRLVLTPERVVVAEARRTLTLLALRGIRVDRVIVNRLLPKARGWRGSAAKWLRTRRGEQEQVRAELAKSYLGGQVNTVSYRANEPVGVAALREIAAELYPHASPTIDTADRSPSPLLQVSEIDGGYRLDIALPLTRGTEVGLARIDNDLAITIDGFRRLIALPEFLRPASITSAESDEHGMRITFTLAGDTRD